MEIFSYTSNIRPYSELNGTKSAYKNNNGIGTPNSNSLKASLSLVNGIDEQHDVSAAMTLKMTRDGQELTKDEREKIVEQMNEFVDSMNKGVSFHIDEESGRDVVTIYETKSGDVIRQIPDEELLVVLRRLAKHSAHSGLVVEKV